MTNLHTSSEVPTIILEAEKWLPVVGYEGKYEISSIGNVRSLNRQVFHARSGKMIMRRGKSMKPRIDSYGYYVISL